MLRPLYIESLIHVGTEINPQQTLWYNNHIIGNISKYYLTRPWDEEDEDEEDDYCDQWSDKLIVEFNSFFRMHTGQYDLAHLTVDSIDDLHNRLKEFDFTVLNNKKI